MRTLEFWQGNKEVSYQTPMIRSLGKILVKVKLQIILHDLCKLRSLV